jgi:hypothetical protein
MDMPSPSPIGSPQISNLPSGANTGTGTPIDPNSGGSISLLYTPGPGLGSPIMQVGENLGGTPLGGPLMVLGGAINVINGISINPGTGPSSTTTTPAP